MKLRKAITLLLAALMLLSSGCTLRIVEKPLESAPVFAPSDAPVPSQTPKVSPTPTGEPAVSPEPQETPQETPPEAGEKAGGYRRGLVSFDDLSYQRPDFDALAAQIEEVRAMLTDGSSSEEIRNAYDALEDAFKEISNAYSVASLFSDMDLGDEYYAAESELIVEKSSELSVLCTELEIAIENSAHRDVVFWDWTERDFQSLHIADKLYDDEYVALNTRLEAIRNEYWAAQTETTVSFQGREISYDELETLDIDDDTYYRLLNDYYANLNAVVGKLYLELIGIEKKIAFKAGYEDFAAFSYDFDYERDYTPADAARLAEAVKKYAVPESDALYDGFSLAEYSGLMQALSVGDQLSRRKDEIRAYAEEVSPDMKEAYDYLVEYRLSILTDGDNSQQGAYTIYMPLYDIPFIYLHEAGNYTDVLTFVHEFGHFYCNYLGGEDAATENSLDVDEICSQANELLFLPYFSHFSKKDTYSAIVKYQMINALNSMIDGCLYDEFQQYVYSHEIGSVEELNEVYRQISRSYGVKDDDYFVDLGYVWVDVLHNFECPMYYISYATSVIPALQIMSIADSDREEAIRIYNRIVSGDTALGFGAALEQAGLDWPFDEQAVIRTVNSIVDLTGVGAYAEVG